MTAAPEPERSVEEEARRIVRVWFDDATPDTHEALVALFVDAISSAEARGERRGIEMGRQNSAPCVRNECECVRAERDEYRARARTAEAALKEIAKIGYGLDFNAEPEEAARYWGDLAVRYRKIAAKALSLPPSREAAACGTPNSPRSPCPRCDSAAPCVCFSGPY